MMLLVTTAALALVASTVVTAVPAAATAAIPPMIVDVTVNGSDISPRLVAMILAEADAIWRPAGVTFVWQRAPRVATGAAGTADGPFLPNTLHVIIGEARGIGRDGHMPLGWIVFDAVDAPQQEIYLSHANAGAMMAEARGVVGIVADMPLVQRDLLLGRAMGRALAHELGHYLLASKTHTDRGLMKAVLTATELFTRETGAFRIEPAQRSVVAARLTRQPLVASR